MTQTSYSDRTNATSVSAGTTAINGADLKVGDTLWSSNGHPKVISGETKVSWLIAGEYHWQPSTKVPKKALRNSTNSGGYWPQFYTTKEEVDLVLFQRHNYYEVSKLLQTSSPHTFKQIADMLGYKEK